MSKLLFGCGYLGSRIAARWKAVGAEVVVVTRRAERAAELKRHGYATIVANVTRPETLTSLPAAETVVYAVGYDRSSGTPIEDVYAGGLRCVLAALPATTGRVVYISTTGVYGSAGGDWVDETTTPDPQRDGGRASLAAECVLAEHPLGRCGFVLRLAGIYGTGRLPYLDPLRRGEPLAAPTAGYLNLIHVEDAAAAVLAAEQLPLNEGDWPRIFNVSDGHPVVRGEFYREVARRLGAPEPTFIEPAAGSPRAARAASYKRITSEQMRRELGVRLAYPSYLEGLANALGGNASH